MIDASETTSRFVVDSVRTCAQITPPMAAQAVKYGLPSLRTLGQQYAVCDNRGSVGMNAKYLDTMIGFQVHAAGGRNWLEGKGFNIFVIFTDTKQGSYPIVYAAIPGPR
jgi:hypothetical protein